MRYSGFTPYDFNGDYATYRREQIMTTGRLTRLVKAEPDAVSPAVRVLQAALGIMKDIIASLRLHPQQASDVRQVH